MHPWFHHWNKSLHKEHFQNQLMKHSRSSWIQVLGGHFLLLLCHLSQTRVATSLLTTHDSPTINYFLISHHYYSLLLRALKSSWKPCFSTGSTCSKETNNLRLCFKDKWEYVHLSWWQTRQWIIRPMDLQLRGPGWYVGWSGMKVTDAGTLQPLVEDRAHETYEMKFSFHLTT